jgi:dolichol-phosphate mannosyltransferase
VILILLPAYDEAPNIGNVLSKIKDVMEAHNLEYQVLVVNDGSRDSTLSIVQQHASDIPVEVINHRMNRGLWETVRDAFEWGAEHCQPDDVIIRMDSDNTHEPKYIPAMIDKINEGYDVVIASRFQPGGGAEGLVGYRAFISRCANRIMKLFFPVKGVREYSCGYRAYRAEIVQDAIGIFGNTFIDLKGLGFTCTVEKLLKFRMLGARFAEVPFVLRYDQKLNKSKMLSSITTLGYLVMILKYIYPWAENRNRSSSVIQEYITNKATKQMSTTVLSEHAE